MRVARTSIVTDKGVTSVKKFGLSAIALAHGDQSISVSGR